MNCVCTVIPKHPSRKAKGFVIVCRSYTWRNPVSTMSLQVYLRSIYMVCQRRRVWNCAKGHQMNFLKDHSEMSDWHFGWHCHKCDNCGNGCPYKHLRHDISGHINYCCCSKLSSLVNLFGQGKFETFHKTAIYRLTEVKNNYHNL